MILPFRAVGDHLSQLSSAANPPEPTITDIGPSAQWMASTREQMFKLAHQVEQERQEKRDALERIAGLEIRLQEVLRSDRHVATKLIPADSSPVASDAPVTFDPTHPSHPPLNVPLNKQHSNESVVVLRHTISPRKTHALPARPHTIGKKAPDNNHTSPGGDPQDVSGYTTRPAREEKPLPSLRTYAELDFSISCRACRGDIIEL